MCRAFPPADAALTPPAPTERKELLVRAELISPALLASMSLDPATATVVEISSGSELYQMVCHHICATPQARAFSLEIGSGSASRP